MKYKVDSDDDEFHDFDTDWFIDNRIVTSDEVDKFKSIDPEENIKTSLSEGINFYKQEKYEEAHEKFENAKELDANREEASKQKRYVHHCDYRLALVYVVKAEAAENIVEKKQFYKIAANYFQSVKVVTHTNKYKYKDKDEDINLDIEIGNALYNAGELEEALNFLKNTETYNLIEKVQQELRSNANELVLYNPNQPIQSYNSFQNNNNIPFDLIQEVVYQLCLEQQRQSQRIDILEKEVSTVKEMLSNVGIDTLDGINNKIKELEETNSDSYYYYKHFYSGLEDIYIASCVINSDAVVVNAGHLERITSIEKGVCCLLDIATAGYFNPIITAGVSVLHDLGDNTYNSHVEGKLSEILKKLNQVMRKQYDKIMESTTHLKQIALFFTDLRKDDILSIELENTTDSFWNFCKKKILPIQNRLFKNKDKENDPILKLAFNDIISLITYIEHNAEAMIERDTPFIAQIVDRAKAELRLTWEEKVKKNPDNIIEYNLSRIEDNLSEFEIITQKIASGQWEDIPLAHVSLNLRSLKFLKCSWSGIQRGISSFCSKKYYIQECKEKDIFFDEDDLNYFMLLLLYKMCKVNDENIRSLKEKNKGIFIKELVEVQGGPYEENIRIFAEQNKDIIELARTTAPQLFVNEDNINLCIENEEHRKETKKILKLRSSDQFVEYCLNKVCPDLANYKKVEEAKRIKAEQAKLQIEYKQEDNLIPFEIESPRDDNENDNIIKVSGRAIEYNN